jgi:uncharacterized protein YutE (UPF0331/DUF86 family)
MTYSSIEEVLVQKITSLQRCADRARELRARAGADFAGSYDLQDAAVLNVLRACETAIDLANMWLRRDQLGIPSESREAFAILVRERCIPTDLGARLQNMVGFRNVAVHQYRTLEPAIIAAVIDSGMDDLVAFAEIVRRSNME